MKVKELIKELKKFDPESECIIQKDSEGNGYSPLTAANNNYIYIAESPWSGYVYNTNWSAEDADEDEEGWQQLLKQPRVCILHPMN